MPEKVLGAGTNFLVKGEAENTVPLFLSALEAGDTDGVFENDEMPAMTQSPIPRFDLMPRGDYAGVTIQTSRGCPFDCEFCDVVALYGRKHRYKTPDQVIKELEAVYNLGWRHELFISDDNFIGSKKHARAILEKLIQWMQENDEPFNFITQISVNLGQDQEMIDMMTEANFSYVIAGIESPDTDVLARAGKHQNIRYPLAESIKNIRTTV